jgi:DNA-binding NarL/FixJ family response regulator
VAAASPVVRAGLEALLTRSAAVTVVAATSGDALTDDVETHEPQVVLLDVDPRESTPPRVARWIALSPDAVSRTPAFVLLADAPSASWTADAIRAGARGVLPRDATPDEIIAALEGAAVGLVTLPAELAAELLSASRSPAVPRPASAPTQPLTPREVEVLGMLAEGLANKNIAARLGISEHTVKTHVASILTKLDAFSRAEAVAIGARQGLILL